jgi:hypothetical protein
MRLRDVTRSTSSVANAGVADGIGETASTE